MWHYIAPILFTIFIWWFSTGVVLCLGRRAERTFFRSMLAMSVLAILALVVLVHSSAAPTVLGAYTGFTAALLLWGWHEMAFLMGFVTGPRVTPCPSDARGWRRFRFALETLLYHELAILITAFAIVALTWGAPNQAGSIAFLVLWVMRISAKLNLFLGSPNMSEGFLPDRLSYLQTYFRRDQVNFFFALSVTFIGIVLGVAIVFAVWVSDPFSAVTTTLIATLIALALLEHWFLLLPLPDATMWSWAMGDKPAAHKTQTRRAEPPATPSARDERDWLPAARPASTTKSIATAMPGR